MNSWNLHHPNWEVLNGMVRADFHFQSVKISHLEKLAAAKMVEWLEDVSQTALKSAVTH